MQFVPPNDLILTKVAKEIPKDQINSAETRKIVENMLRVAHGQRKNKKRPIMVGLAAHGKASKTPCLRKLKKV